MNEKVNDSDSPEKDSFPKPNMSQSIVPNKVMVRAVSQNNISSSKVQSPTINVETSPLDSKKIKELKNIQNQGYMKETVNSKIKQRQNEDDPNRTFDENPTYVTVS